MRIYTGTGDGGETALFGGARVSKDDLRVEAYGTIDELNACLGLARSSLPADAGDLAVVISALQSELFDLGAELATPPDRAHSKLTSRLRGVSIEQIQALEAHIDRYEAELEPLRSFILPGGCRSSAHLHLARTIARRAERRIVQLAGQSTVSPALLTYVNRLSDLLFVLARTANRLEGMEDIRWTAGQG